VPGIIFVLLGIVTCDCLFDFGVRGFTVLFATPAGRFDATAGR